jgi:hypothetical protein
MRRVTPALALLRATGVAALLLLLWNPVASRPLPDDVQPIVLLDASLSMTGDPWRAALDTARALAAARGALVWRFGTGVAGFDTSAPADGASRLAPALEAAAARGGEVIVVTDGAVDDVATIPPDLLRRPRVVVVPRPAFFDAFVARVEAQRRVSAHDTIRGRVSYGTAGTRDTGSGMRDALLTVSVGRRRLFSRSVALPDSGIVSTEITLPASRIPHPGWSVLEVRLDGVGDAEPRDDARSLVVEVSPQPAAAIFASPPDWETRFLARTLGDVARIPVKAFVETEPGRWRDAATLAPVSTTDLGRAARGARLLVLGGDPERAGGGAGVGRTGPAAQLVWPTGRGPAGDWYVERPPASPLAAALAGVVWDSLPPAIVAGDPPRGERDGTVTALTARLGRRGAARAIVTLDERDGRRRATVTASGLWRWAFRGGAAGEAYRSLVAALADWLLGEGGAGTMERAVPVTLEVPNGLPLVWRWAGASPAPPGELRPLAIDLNGERGAHRDTLRFDAAGRAELRLPPGVYRYAFAGGPERGIVTVEEYSDEWRPPPAAVALAAQPGAPEGRVARAGLRDRWWLFVVALAAFTAEWAWRRRHGLP